MLKFINEKIDSFLLQQFLFSSRWIRIGQVHVDQFSVPNRFVLVRIPWAFTQSQKDCTGSLKHFCLTVLYSLVEYSSSTDDHVSLPPCWCLGIWNTFCDIEQTKVFIPLDLFHILCYSLNSKWMKAKTIRTHLHTIPHNDVFFVVHFCKCIENEMHVHKFSHPCVSVDTL